MWRRGGVGLVFFVITVRAVDVLGDFIRRQPVG